MILTWMRAISFLAINVDSTFKRHDNVVIITWDSHKITMVPLKQTQNSTKPQLESFLTLTNGKWEIADSIRDTNCNYLVVVKGLMVASKNGEDISIEVHKILNDF